MAVIDLSQLPAPQIVDVPDFETLLAERKAEFVALHPKDEQEAVIRTLDLESEPVTKLLQENAYRELLLRQRINEAAQAVMVAYAMGGDLDQIAANYNVKRLMVTPADNDAVPPVAAVMESDEALRLRVPAAFEGLSVAGPTAAYEFHARSADGRVADASATSPAPAEVVLTVLSREGDGHRFTLADRGAYTGVIASWLHTREPRKKETTRVKRRRKKATTPKEPEAKQGDYLVGTDENVLVLNRTYANRSNAERAAKMQWERLQRGVASFSLLLAEGRADLYTEMPVKVTGFKQPIDDAEWTITTLTHSVSPDNGFTTSMELEVKIDDLEIE
ncbi:hypothetical protein HNE72_003817 [Salmonella enterica]|nr:hypothetical protein [Salmonella enterica]EBP3941949.1 hypothetical protein [Salmonella enterica subsp. enterica]ECF6201545.1 hypothetical protein [Salmonella enterica subsp. houtenae]EDW8147428.1 hypothetical protein [Salmonella enterica subsp. houtenae serovar 45:g,z51:-]EAR7469757.1 hypothetical protein [Salmonella enterica]